MNEHERITTKREGGFYLRAVCQARTPGCAVAIIKDGVIVYEQGYGLADLKYSLPILAEF